MKHIRMKAKDAAAWLAALRSGEYERGRFTLRAFGGEAIPTPLPDKTSYCCLGVLEMALAGQCELLSLPSENWLKRHNIEFWNPLTTKDGFEGIHRVPYIESQQRSLDELNDNSDLTFAQIADLIEPEIDFIDEEVTP